MFSEVTRIVTETTTDLFLHAVSKLFYRWPLVFRTFSAPKLAPNVSHFTEVPIRWPADKVQTDYNGIQALSILRSISRAFSLYKIKSSISTVFFLSEWEFTVFPRWSEIMLPLDQKRTRLRTISVSQSISWSKCFWGYATSCLDICESKVCLHVWRILLGDEKIWI